MEKFVKILLNEIQINSQNSDLAEFNFKSELIFDLKNFDFTNLTDNKIEEKEKENEEKLNEDFSILNKNLLELLNNWGLEEEINFEVNK